MKQISSLELNYLVKELSLLINGRVDKVYQSKKEELLIQFYVSGKGKKLLKVIVGKAIFLTDTKDEYDEPSSFCMFLRKQLSSSKLKEISQKEPERIIELVFEKEENKKLIIEFFGGGNVILCDKEDNILSALIYRKYKERAILPKNKYTYPSSKVNLFRLKIDELRNLIKGSIIESAVKSLAVELGLGGIYAEEVCLLSNIDKKKKPNDLNDSEIKNLFKEIDNLKNKKLNPLVVYDKGDIIDAVPSSLEFYKDNVKKEFDNFSKALEFYFDKIIEKKPSKYEKQINKLRNLIEKQESQIKELGEKESDERKKAELIYNNYNLIKEIIEQVNKASEKYSWKEITEKLKGHKVIKKVDGKEKMVVLEIKQ